MKKRVVICIYGETGVGKTHTALSLKDSMCVDMTMNNEAMIAAMNVYGDRFEERYRVVRDFDELMKCVEVCEQNNWLCCLETADSLRDVLAREYMRREGKKKERIYPITEWGKVYDIAREIFFGSDCSFTVTGGLKDQYTYDEELGRERLTGKKIPDGLKVLPEIADVVAVLYLKNGKQMYRIVKSRFEHPSKLGDVESLKEYIERFKRMIKW